MSWSQAGTFWNIVSKFEQNRSSGSRDIALWSLAFVNVRPTLWTEIRRLLGADSRTPQASWIRCIRNAWNNHQTLQSNTYGYRMERMMDGQEYYQSPKALWLDISVRKAWNWLVRRFHNSWEEYPIHECSTSMPNLGYIRRRAAVGRHLRSLAKSQSQQMGTTGPRKSRLY